MEEIAMSDLMNYHNSVHQRFMNEFIETKDAAMMEALKKTLPRHILDYDENNILPYLPRLTEVRKVGRELITMYLDYIYGDDETDGTGTYLFSYTEDKFQWEEEYHNIKFSYSFKIENPL